MADEGPAGPLTSNRKIRGDPGEGTVLLAIRRATKLYRMGEVDVLALREVSLDIRDGEFLVIVGPSGSGKSTLLSLIGGMDRPTSGSVFFRGEDLAAAPERILTLYRRHQVGFVFQFFNLIPTLTALENVQAAAELVAEPVDPERALELVGLTERAGHFPAQLSGGEQQRVAIARAMASNPRLLLCDEPTGSLDLATSLQILQLLTDLNTGLGKTVVLITHNMAIAGIGDRVAHMRDGAIAALTVNEHRTPVAEVAW